MNKITLNNPPNAADAIFKAFDSLDPGGVLEILPGLLLIDRPLQLLDKPFHLHAVGVEFLATFRGDGKPILAVGAQKKNPNECRGGSIRGLTVSSASPFWWETGGTWRTGLQAQNCCEWVFDNVSSLANYQGIGCTADGPTMYSGYNRFNIGNISNAWCCFGADARNGAWNNVCVVDGGYWKLRDGVPSDLIPNLSSFFIDLGLESMGGWRFINGCYQTGHNWAADQNVWFIRCKQGMKAIEFNPLWMEGGKIADPPKILCPGVDWNKLSRDLPSSYTQIM